MELPLTLGSDEKPGRVYFFKFCKLFLAWKLFCAKILTTEYNTKKNLQQNFDAPTLGEDPEVPFLIPGSQVGWEVPEEEDLEEEGPEKEGLEEEGSKEEGQEEKVSEEHSFKFFLNLGF